MNRRFSRRGWLQLGACTLGAIAANHSVAAEARGRWSDESIAEYNSKLFDWLKANFAMRAETLRVSGGADFTLKYDYLDPKEDRKKLRLFEKFAEGRLSGPAGEEHLVACLTELEAVRKLLAAAEVTAAAQWKAEREEIIKREGMIYDTAVSAGRLTVVMDASRSMAPHLEALRKEISRNFGGSHFVEVNGCQLTHDAICPWFFSAPAVGMNPFTPERHIPEVPKLEDSPHSRFISWTRDAPSALDCMVDLMNTDAIYWFCDFDDPTSDVAIRTLAKKVLERKVALYIHTMDKKPPALLATLAEKSGGSVVRKRI